MDILIIKLGAIGDVIRTTSILSGLKEKYKNCRIDWLTKKESFDVLKNNNFINKLFLIDNDIVKIENNEYDLIISLDDDNEACTLAAKISHKELIGAYLDNGKRVYTQNSSLWFDIGLISKFGKKKADELKAKNKKTYQQIMYEILDLDYKKQEPILGLTKDEINFGENFAKKNNMKSNDEIIGINTGAGGRWQDKKLSIEETAELIDKLNESIDNAKLLLFGGPEEKERNEKIKKTAKGKIIDAGCDNSLMEFASLVNLCNILVTSDSLALHIGTALKKNIVSFYYPTSAAEIENYGRGIKIVGKGKDYCSYKTKCTYPAEWDIDKIANAVKTIN
ncbi:glycosyltransferase family 9 protein [Candidatus Woesearchaeota archaeon]|nr:glycosyltransferase family 9 protein [Candidatus Woesearchaeota archaeon]